jgi:hypothetical protein
MVRQARHGRSGDLLMNRARACIAVLAIPLVTSGLGVGCLGQAERTYFDDLVDGSTDATTNPPIDSPGPDTTTPDTSTPDGPLVDDATDGPATPDAADGGERMDAVADAPSTPESGLDSGPDCGPTNTVTNCGQCGAACDTTHGSPTSCTASACHYTCNAGWGDCQQSAPDLNGCETPLTTPSNCTACGIACDTTHSLDAGCSGTTCTYSGCAAGYVDCHTAAPNADGCECNAPACCEAGVCEPLHDNGVGQTYYDCAPIGTYSAGLALKACVAYTGSAAKCVSYPCTPSSLGPIICSAGDSTKNCMCWSFGGNDVGTVDNGGAPPGSGGANCFCPSGDPPWN